MKRIAIRIAFGLLVLVVAAAGGFVYLIGGFANAWGMLRYDQRQEGHLQVGDRAPDVTLLDLDGTTRVSLLEKAGGKPLVLIFGSYT